ncbi:MAG: glutamine-synthetase adenylyltransferase, partial [Alphaproteobacteria bacterium]|nr:glutamine-synthetase adenylyltransferase [Alphaproteobacteria bacterium]
MQFLNLIPSHGSSLPLPTDLAQANLAFAALAETPAAEALNAALAHDIGRALLNGAFDGSPYLARAAEKTPQAFIDCMDKGPDAAFAQVITMLESVASASSQPAAMATLRQAKLGGALIIGLADLAGIWTLEQVTGAVSELARRSVDAALGWLLADAAKRNVFLTDDPTGEALLRHGGLIVLGMGKLGAEELNYSSDIDLIVLFDPEKIEAKRPDRLQHEMVRLTRGLVTMMEELTRDGYVFRTDLRLRPDPASTPMALSVDAAEVYYESAGQNWERAAMIKARPIAGDLAAGAAFMKGLRPFVWRRSLDFNAIRDIQSIKRQIDRKQGGEPPSAFNQNVKLGRGGIREIEFFAQTQQLIWGGRDTSLRDCGTLPALEALVRAGHVTAGVEADLNAAYRKLRTIEHRLQMVDDRQTHLTPEADEA